MYKNHLSDNNMPHFVEHIEGEMEKNVNKKSFLEIEKSINNDKLLFPIHINFDNYQTHEQLYKAIHDWWTQTKNKAEKTIKTRINCMRYCQRHPIYPVNWFRFDKEPEQMLNLLLYLINIEYKQKAQETGNYNYGIHQIHNIWKTIKTMAQAKGVNIDWWGWNPPSRPQNKVKIIPLPKTVNKIIHHKYSKDRITNSLIKTMLTVGFNTGLRPEELIKLRIKNIYFESNSIILTEEKKRYRNRQLRLDPPVIHSRKQNSLHNWIKIWRTQIPNHEHSNYVFLQKNGRPFTTSDAFRTFLTKHGIKDIWKQFSPKKMRDWNAIARLIRTKLQKSTWDIREVTKKLGHKYQNTTEGYVEFAELYYENEAYDWLRAVLKHQKCLMREYRSSQKPIKSINAKKHVGLIKSYLLEKMLPTGYHTWFLLLEKSSKPFFNRFFSISLPKIFSSFFITFFPRKNNQYTHSRGWDLFLITN